MKYRIKESKYKKFFFLNFEKKYLMKKLILQFNSYGLLYYSIIMTIGNEITLKIIIFIKIKLKISITYKVKIILTPIYIIDLEFSSYMKKVFKSIPTHTPNHKLKL